MAAALCPQACGGVLSPGRTGRGVASRAVAPTCGSASSCCGDPATEAQLTSCQAAGGTPQAASAGGTSRPNEGAPGCSSKTKNQPWPRPFSPSASAAVNGKPRKRTSSPIAPRKTGSVRCPSRRRGPPGVRGASARRACTPRDGKRRTSSPRISSTTASSPPGGRRRVSPRRANRSQDRIGGTSGGSCPASWMPRVSQKWRKEVADRSVGNSRHSSSRPSSWLAPARNASTKGPLARSRVTVSGGTFRTPGSRWSAPSSVRSSAIGRPNEGGARRGPSGSGRPPPRRSAPSMRAATRVVTACSGSVAARTASAMPLSGTAGSSAWSARSWAASRARWWALAAVRKLAVMVVRRWAVESGRSTRARPAPSPSQPYQAPGWAGMAADQARGPAIPSTSQPMR